MNLDTLNVSILGPAFLAGLLVLATHVPLGQQVLKRGIVFIDLAVAQIAALGVIAADAMGWEPQGIKVQIAAVCAALLGALLLTWTEKKWPEVQEGMSLALREMRVDNDLGFTVKNPGSSNSALAKKRRNKTTGTIPSTINEQMSTE